MKKENHKISPQHFKARKFQKLQFKACMVLQINLIIINNRTMRECLEDMMYVYIDDFVKQSSAVLSLCHLALLNESLLFE